MISQHRVILAVVWIAALTVLAVWITVLHRLNRFMKRQTEETRHDPSKGEAKDDDA